jgi:hypothetical protein
MSLQKYDVVRTMVPFETFDDKERGRRTLTFDKLLEAQLSGDYKYNRPCVVLGTDKQSGHIIIAEMRSNRNKPFRSEVNDIDVAGIDHESALLVRQESLIYVEPDLVPVIESDKCGFLSKDDIQRFEHAFISTNVKQELKQKLQPQVEQTSISDKQLLNKLEQVETESLNSTTPQQFTPEVN